MNDDETQKERNKNDLVEPAGADPSRAEGPGSGRDADRGPDTTENSGAPEAEEQAKQPEVVRVVGAKFKRACKTYFFNAGNLLFNIGEQVIVETDRGLGLARVVTPVAEFDTSQLDGELKKIIRKAHWNDIERDKKNRAREREAHELCSKMIHERGHNMKLVQVEYLHDASKAVFYFTAEQRVDFRELVKSLARELHTRIEMRQIGVRDESKIMGGIGPCGREVCCATFLTEFSPVSVRMAKDQDLAMNPSKVSGLCGRLMCCLAYEHTLYREMGKSMPRKGKRLECPHGPCKVVDLNILAEKVLVELESGKTMFVKADELYPPGQEPPPSPEEEQEEEDLGTEVLESDDPQMIERAGHKNQEPQGAAAVTTTGSRSREHESAPHAEKHKKPDRQIKAQDKKRGQQQGDKPKAIQQEAGKKPDDPQKRGHKRRGRRKKKKKKH